MDSGFLRDGRQHASACILTVSILCYNVEWNKIEKDEIWTKICFTLDPVLNIGPFALLAKWISDSDFLVPLNGPCYEYCQSSNKLDNWKSRSDRNLFY